MEMQRAFTGQDRGGGTAWAGHRPRSQGIRTQCSMHPAGGEQWWLGRGREGMVACRSREEGARWSAAGHMVRILEGGNALWETKPQKHNHAGNPNEQPEPPPRASGEGAWMCPGWGPNGPAVPSPSPSAVPPTTHRMHTVCGGSSGALRVARISAQPVHLTTSKGLEVFHHPKYLFGRIIS